MKNIQLPAVLAFLPTRKGSGSEGNLMQKIRDFKIEDAAALAQCINESEEGWPGGITGGVQNTAEHVIDDYNRQVKITWLIAEDENKVTGVSTLHPHFEDPNAAYLGFLNVADPYRKQGFGKALLIESVRRVYVEGYKILFLHTWAGNLNAVPVYKKTGFFWQPDSNVLMENYLPTVLGLPMAQPFFQKHPDWYSSYQREIALKPDEMEHRGLRVYEMVWRADDDFLRVLIDRESRGPTLIETDEALVECWIAHPEPALGVPLPVYWSIQNKTLKAPLNCQIKVKLPKGFEIVEGPPKEVTVEPGQTITIEGTILGKVNVIPQPKDKAAFVMTSQLMIDNIPVELKTGLRVMHPLEVSTVPRTLWCRPGNQIKLAIGLKSNLHSPAQGTVKISSAPGMQLAQKQFDVSVKPEETTGFDIEATINSSLGTRAIPIKVRANLLVNGTPLQTRTETLYLHCLDSGGVLVTPFDDNKRLQVHTEALHLEINLAKGAHIDRLYSKLSGKQHLRSVCRDGLGPPFWPSEQMRTHYKHQIEQSSDGTTRILAWMDSQKYSGLKFTKTFILSGGSSIIRIEYGFQNRDPSISHDLQLMIASIPAVFNHLLVMPLKDGIIREEMAEAEFPSSNLELPKKREDWEETWFCAETPETGDITAILCDPNVFHEARGQIFLNFALKIPLLAPESEIKIPPVYLIAGPGTWQHVRQLWHQLYGIQPPLELSQPQPHRAIEVSTESTPLLIEYAKEVVLPITLFHRVNRPIDGKIRFSPPKGWQISPRTKTFKGLERKAPQSFSVTIKAAGRKAPTAELLPLQALLDTELRNYFFDLPVIVSRTTGNVEVTQTREENCDVFIIDNGTYLLKIAPSFTGSVYALINKVTRTNFLKSTFPKAGPMVWMNPWYGGIRFDPFAIDQNDWFPTRLDRESWSARQVIRKEWTGVELTVKPGKKERKLKGFKLGFQILTQPNSNIFALIGRFTNLTSATRQVNHRFKVGLQPKGDPTGLETIVPRTFGFLRRRRISKHGWPTTSQPYLGIEHAKDDATIVFIAPYGPEGAMFLGDLPPDVILFSTQDPVTIPAKTTVERYGYFVVTNASWEQAKHYSQLLKLRF